MTTGDVPRFTSGVFFLSTLEEEWIKDNWQGPPLLPTCPVMAPGTYRVIDGKLFRIVPGVPYPLEAGGETR